MSEFTGTIYSENKAYKDISLFPPGIFESGTIIYEVLRTLNGCSLFLEDHLNRLQDSVKLSGYLYRVSVPFFQSLLTGLIQRNGFSEGNIKIVLRFCGDNDPAIYTYFIPHFYPTPEMYSQGVRAALFNAVRTNPNVKKVFPEIRARVAAFIQSSNIHDALLVDEHENITEGSKTNVFFVKGQTLYTAPGDKVLRGITREKVLYLCNQLNIKFIEQSVSINSLNKYDAAFFTGTSPKILPIKSIAGCSYNVKDPVVSRLMKAYDDLTASCLDG